jgi:hypothetical protein
MHRSSQGLLLVIAVVGVVSAAACGATTGPIATGTTTSGSTSPSSSTGSGHGGSNGAGGQGGAPGMSCPTTPPNNGDSCAGFALGAQCNYGSSSSSLVSSTECQCDGTSSEGLAWSCGTEAVTSGG